MPDHRVTHCRSCRAPIVWMKTVAGKNMPVDPEGIDEDDELFDPRKHTSHFSTCPQADDHRRR